MILILHVIIALLSMAYTGYVYFRPTQTGIKCAYLLVATTLGTGTYLVASTDANLIRTCFTGLVYLGFVMTGIVSAQRTLARGKEKL